MSGIGVGIIVAVLLVGLLLDAPRMGEEFCEAYKDLTPEEKAELFYRDGVL